MAPSGSPLSEVRPARPLSALGTGVRQALAAVEAALSGAETGPVLAEGAAGAGKTTLLRELARRAPPGVEARFVPFVNVGPGELEMWLAGLGGRAGAEGAALSAELLERRAPATGLWLLVDELQSMPPPTAAALGALHRAWSPGLRLVLAGTHGPTLETVVHALGVPVRRVRIEESLDVEEVVACIAARAAAAGLAPDALADAAALHRATGGVPALVMQVLEQRVFACTRSPRPTAEARVPADAQDETPADAPVSEPPPERPEPPVRSRDGPRPAPPARVRAPGTRAGPERSRRAGRIGLAAGGVALLGLAVAALLPTAPPPREPPETRQSMAAPPSPSPPLAAPPASPPEAAAPPASPLEATAPPPAFPPGAAPSSELAAAEPSEPAPAGSPAARASVVPQDGEPDAAGAAPASSHTAVTPPAPVPVHINARPWATVFVDGRRLGETPLADVPLAPGTHELRAVFPDGRELRRRIHVETTTRAIALP